MSSSESDPVSFNLSSTMDSAVLSSRHQNRSSNDPAELKSKLQKKESRIRELEQKVNRLDSASHRLAEVRDLFGGKVRLSQVGGSETRVVDQPSEFDLTVGDYVLVTDAFTIAEVVGDYNSAREQHPFEVVDSPDVTYADVGGLDQQIADLKRTIQQPLNSSTVYDELGLNPPTGALLHGPPGTGKTMLAKAVANEAGATFLSISGSEFAKKLVGEGAALIRDLFTYARNNTPAIIFIDEVDAVGSARTERNTGSSEELDRTLNQLLTELDGFNTGTADTDVRVLAATNRLEKLDKALLRPGRFDRKIKIPHPDVTARRDIFQSYTDNLPLADPVTSESLAEEFTATGAQIEALCREAALVASERDDDLVITFSDFQTAAERVFDTTDGTNNTISRYCH